MRIVDRATFLSMPVGTLFYKYEPCIMSDFSIKGDTLRQMTDTDAADFFFVTLDQPWVDSPTSSDYHTPITEMELKGASYPIDVEVEGRDACFDREQMFAVLDEQDVRLLIARLTKCLPSPASNKEPT